jgi:hypothetical protein
MIICIAWTIKFPLYHFILTLKLTFAVTARPVITPAFFFSSRRLCSFTLVRDLNERNLSCIAPTKGRKALTIEYNLLTQERNYLFVDALFSIVFYVSFFSLRSIIQDMPLSFLSYIAAALP